MLTTHQLEHLNAVIKDTDDAKIADSATKKILAESKGIKTSKFNAYLDKVKTDAQSIIDSGIWPSELKNASSIHNFLEK